MGERLSKGARIHNRREKALAWQEHREPVLITPKPTDIKQPTIIIRSLRQEPPTEEEVKLAREKLLSLAPQGIHFDLLTDLHDPFSYELPKELQKLAKGIERGKILSREKIALRVERLAFHLKYLSILDKSDKTELDLAALKVLDTIEANKNRLTE